MMQATEHGEWDDSPIATRGCRCKLLLAWDPLLNALMRSRLVEVDDILCEHPVEVGFAQNEDVMSSVARMCPMILINTAQFDCRQRCPALSLVDPRSFHAVSGLACVPLACFLDRLPRDNSAQ